MPYEMVNRVTELESQLKRMREDADIWDLLSEHRLPFGHERHLRAIAASMEERTSFNEVYDTMGSLKPFYLEGAEEVIPRPLRLTDLANDEWRDRYVQTSCACLSQAAELHSLSSRATHDVRPMLMADSARLLYTFLLRSVSMAPSVPSDMGIIVNLEGGDASTAILEINPYGFLPRLVITLAALERPSAFTPVIPDLETYKEDRWIVYEQRTDLSLEKVVRVRLEDLVDHDFEADARSQTLKWVIEDFQARYIETSDLIRDLLLKVAAAEIARKEPAGWKEAMRGITTELGRHVDEAHGRLRDGVRTTAEILAAVEDGQKSAYVATGYHYV
ncbi:MAG: hypothetical protein JSW25_00640 [Thermoplasmata archaeon]|nr:MAG: hypothetical protein JSW25_00640 [Thermoplasmata archaeon]